MNFELVENLSQVMVFVCATLAATFLAIRYKDRRPLILAFAYACFFMGTLYYVLCLAVTGDVPQVFYVAEVSWLASYLFYLSLQIVRVVGLNLRFSPRAAVTAAIFMVTVILLQIFGPSRLMSGLLALTIGAMVYLTLLRLHTKGAFRLMDGILLVCVVLEILLYVISSFPQDYTRFNLYFATDILMTVLFVTLLPLTMREVKHDLH